MALPFGCACRSRASVDYIWRNHDDPIRATRTVVRVVSPIGLPRKSRAFAAATRFASRKALHVLVDHPVFGPT
ncbi:hypothetical protein Rrhod_2418 [Rhodococcus rhodnii LMG 5362]|uniref:Uncharacterized protein n=1 Tax=Rhodococcus rhodnii LMG 5362 TaxID=1273125 RepID=R7WLN6_9NOCA|nr:hypothetical protein Rrhod_2418 [Rhodococcus rhodnii LMG 5362]